MTNNKYIHVVSYLFSTSNHNIKPLLHRGLWVVSYLFSTSNHNNLGGAYLGDAVVSYLFSTSNHNKQLVDVLVLVLYLICFLHQTTTFDDAVLLGSVLYLICFLHQTTT